MRKSFCYRKHDLNTQNTCSSHSYSLCSWTVVQYRKLLISYLRSSY